MSEKRVSALLIIQDDDLVGTLADRDLSRKVVAARRDTSEPVSALMTRTSHTIDASAHTIDASALAFEVLLDPTENAVHHLPVLEDGRVIGLVTAGDLMRLEQAKPLYLDE